jgi:enamine deaminase RidA (YjgF/YER057c/UK114 family)
MQRESVNPWDWGLAWSMDQGEVLTDVSRQLHVSGQLSLRPDPAAGGELVVIGTGDMRLQLECALANVDAILWKARMRRDNIVSLRFYTTDVDAFMDNYDIYTQWIAPTGVRPPQSVLGVQRLVMPELLIEVEAVAAA